MAVEFQHGVGKKKSKQTVKSVKLINFEAILPEFKLENVANDSQGGLAYVSRLF